MKNTLRHWAFAAVGAAAALALTSCYYDPYYSTGGGYSTAGGSYSTGYGEGYGYGSSSFNTSIFVGTGDPRWGYDPYCYSYYDYHRRCYYDPYLHGYYPVGYRPPIVVGVPHPHGYRHGYCPAPTYVRYGTVPNYRNRVDEYRGSNYGWARQVRQQPATQGRVQDKHPSRQTSNTRSNTDSRPSANHSNYGRQSSNVRPSSGGSSRQEQGRRNYTEGTKPTARQPHGRLPSSYNTPVTSSSRQNQSVQRNKAQNQSRQSQPKVQGGHQGKGRQNQPAPDRDGNEGRQEEKRGGGGR